MLVSDGSASDHPFARQRYQHRQQPELPQALPFFLFFRVECCLCLRRLT
jgi:hypothetical protein